MRISTSMQYNSHLNYLQTANTKVDQASTQYNRTPRLTKPRPNTILV